MDLTKIVSSIFLFCLLGATISTTYAQTPDLQGKWELEKVALEKYTPSGELLAIPATPNADQAAKYGLFQGLQFEDKGVCQLMLGVQTSKGSYVQEYADLTLNVDNSSYRYTAVVADDKLELFRVFEHVDQATAIATSYRMTLLYKKQ